LQLLTSVASPARVEHVYVIWSTSSAVKTA